MEFEGWDMEDKAKYKKIIPFRMDDDFTYGNMSNGKKDKDKREKIRAEAKKETFALGYKGFNKFAFRIFVTKSKRLFDIENVPKLIVDAFCENK